MSGRIPSLTEFDDEVEITGGTFIKNIIDDGQGGFGILISGVNETVCQNMIEVVLESTNIQAVTKEHDINNPLTDCSGSNNNFFVVFNKDLRK